jgi:hypothetical protein
MSTSEKASVASRVAASIEQGIDHNLMDVDKDGKTTPLGDGLMVIRRLFGSALEASALTSKAISPESPCFPSPADFAAVAANIDALAARHKSETPCNRTGLIALGGHVAMRAWGCETKPSPRGIPCPAAC